MRSNRTRRQGALLVAATLPALAACPGFLRSAAKGASSTVSSAGATVKGAARTGLSAVQGVIPEGWTEAIWKEERQKAKEEAKGLEQYDGSRQAIKAQGTKLAAMPMKAAEVEPRVAFILDDLLLTEMFNVGFEAIGPEDINDMIGFETMKEELGSDDTTNLSEFGNSLGVRYLTAGSVANLDGSQVVTLKLIEVENQRVMARVNRMSEGDTKILPRIIAQAVQDLVKRSKL